MLSCRNGKNYSESERKGDAADQRRKGSANESSDWEKGGLSQGVGRKQKDGIRKKVCSVPLAL